MKKTLIGLMVSVLVLAGCTNGPATNDVPSTTGSTENQPVEKRVVKIGVIAPLSGPASTYGEDAVNSYNYAIKKFASNLSGIDLQLIIEDGKCNGKDSVDAVNKLINIDKVSVILGGLCDSEFVASAQIGQKKKVVMISPTASGPEISNFGDYIFRYFSDKGATEKLSKFLSENNVQSISIVYSQTDYGTTYFKGLKESFSGNILLEIPFSESEKDFNIVGKQIESKLNSLGAIVVVPNSDETAVAVGKQLNKIREEKEFSGMLIGSQLFGSDGFLSGMGNTSNGMYTVAFKDVSKRDGDTNIEFEAFKKEHKVLANPRFVVLEIDAMKLLIDAIKNGNIDTESIKLFLEGITENNKRKGIFGDYYFDKNGDISGLEFFIHKIQSGQVVAVE